ncbi:hypothetical protein NC653_040370 [Populus alba x Populus x berolinensis]|nr:hypothetical protein NC653_040370 [Populus alba x Populus x berolinensis]
MKLLHELDLSNNQFVGKFPKVVLSLPSLKYLDLRFNEFEENLGNSPVSVLVLANNNLGGCIPGSIGKMGKTLNEIILMNDNLTGCFPPKIGMLKKVTVFTGVVPASVCQLHNLQNFTYSFNYFTGEAPSCAAIGVVSNGTQNCIPGKMNQRSAKQCSSEAARPVDCNNFKCGGSGGGGENGSPLTPPSQSRRVIPVGRPSPNPAPIKKTFVASPPPPTSKSSPSTRSHPPPPPTRSFHPTTSLHFASLPPPTKKASPRTHLPPPPSPSPPPVEQQPLTYHHIPPPPPSPPPSNHYRSNYTPRPLIKGVSPGTHHHVPPLPPSPSVNKHKVPKYKPPLPPPPYQYKAPTPPT